MRPTNFYFTCSSRPLCCVSVQNQVKDLHQYVNMCLAPELNLMALPLMWTTSHGISRTTHPPPDAFGPRHMRRWTRARRQPLNYNCFFGILCPSNRSEVPVTSLYQRVGSLVRTSFHIIHKSKRHLLAKYDTTTIPMSSCT